MDYTWGSIGPGGTVTPTPALTPTPAPTPTDPGVRTWTGGYQGSRSDPCNWSPAVVPTGEGQIVIEGTGAQIAYPVLAVDFTLTTGSINIWSTNGLMKVSSGVNFTNNGTVTAGHDFLNDGTVVNNGVFANRAVLHASGGSGGFRNTLGGLLNNAVGGSSTGVIVNACGGTVKDLGDLWSMANEACVWSGVGGDDLWFNQPTGLYSSFHRWNTRSSSTAKRVVTHSCC